MKQRTVNEMTLITIKHLLTRYSFQFKALGLVVAYLLWTLLFQHIFLSVLTYFLMSSSSDTRLQDINEALNTNLITMAGLSALIFLVVIRNFYPVSIDRDPKLTDGARFNERFVPGFLRGTMIAVGLTLALLVTGHYSYLGFLFEVSETPLVVFSIFIRFFALAGMVYCEEFIFRQRLVSLLKGKLPSGILCFIVSLAYCLIKTFQFNLTSMHLLSLFLISTILTLKLLSEKNFLFGAGLWFGILSLFHVAIGLPIFGSKFSGIFLIEYTDPLIKAAEHLSGAVADAHLATESWFGFETNTHLFLTGGTDGPISSFSLQIILITIIINQFLIYNKSKKSETKWKHQMPQ